MQFFKAPVNKIMNVQLSYKGWVEQKRNLKRTSVSTLIRGFQFLNQTIGIPTIFLNRYVYEHQQALSYIVHITKRPHKIRPSKSFHRAETTDLNHQKYGYLRCRSQFLFSKCISSKVGNSMIYKCCLFISTKIQVDMVTGRMAKRE